MLKRIELLDDWLMDKYETVSRYIQRLTGYSCFKQAKITSVAAPICFGLLVFSGNKDTIGITGIILEFIWIFLFSVLYFVSNLLEEKSNGMTMNPGRIHFFIHRILLLLAGAPILLLDVNFPRKIAWAIFFFLLTSSAYLVCCTPLPPCRKN